jgi:hypothetical protein
VNLAIAKLLILVNLFLPGAIPQGFIFSGTTGNTYTYIGTGKNSSTCGSLPCTATYSPTAGHAIVFVYEMTATAGTVVGYDNSVDSFTTDVQDTTTVSGRIFGIGHICSVGAGVTSIGFNVTGSSGFSGGLVIIAEASYTGTCSLGRVSTVATNTSTTSLTGGSVTPAVANAWIVGMFFDTTVSQAATGTGIYTDFNDTGDGTRSINGLDAVVNTTGTYAPTATVGSSATAYGYTVNLQ